MRTIQDTVDNVNPDPSETTAHQASVEMELFHDEPDMATLLHDMSDEDLHAVDVSLANNAAKLERAEAEEEAQFRKAEQQKQVISLADIDELQPQKWLLPPVQPRLKG